MTDEIIAGGLEQARILIVDDEERNVALLEAILVRARFQNLKSSTDPREALRLFDSFAPDLVLLDLRMPELDGFAVLEEIGRRQGPGSYLPVLVLTAEGAPEAKRKALSMGARDFLAKPFDVTEVLLRIQNLLQTRFLHTALARQNEILEERVTKRTDHLMAAVESLKRSEQQTRAATHETIQRLASAAELRDEETGRHIERMSRYSGLLALRLGMGSEQCELIRMAASMHDIGKIGVPDSILRKNAGLTDAETLQMSTHAEIGHRILAGSQAEVVETAAIIALTHHERFDGAGYPHGLAGEQIPLEGRIATIADVFDALTSDRVYRRAFSFEQAVDMMRAERARHFEPDLLDVFLDSMDDVSDVWTRYSDDRLGAPEGPLYRLNGPVTS